MIPLRLASSTLRERAVALWSRTTSRGWGARSMLMNLGRLLISEHRYAADVWQPPHDHPYCSYSLVYAGGLEERVGSRTITARALSTVVKPAGTVHSDRFGV